MQRAKPLTEPKSSRIARGLSRVAYALALRPNATLLLTVLITVAAGWTALTQLEFHTSRLDLLSPASQYNQRWLNYLDKFGHDDDAVVVVSHADPGRVAHALLATGKRLEADSKLSGVLYRKSLGHVADKAMHLLPSEELQQLDQLLSVCMQVTQALGGPAHAAGPAPAHSPAQSQGPVLSAEFTAHCCDTEPMLSWLQQLPGAIAQAQSGMDRLRQLVPEEGPLLIEDNGTLGMCLVRLPHPDEHPQLAQSQMATLAHHLDQLRAAHPGVEFWLTGMPVLEWDESLSSQQDMQRATLISLAGVAVIFAVGFGSWRLPCAAVVCLAIGLIWTVGLTTITIGHLNLFSVAFGAIIAGLGIDYAIHLLSRLQFVAIRSPGTPLVDALAESVEHCGAGILTGAVSTAAAFLVAMLTPFRGISELGLICGLGTMCCVAATIFVLPAMIAWQATYLPTVRKRDAEAADQDWWTELRPGRWLLAFDRGLEWSSHAVSRGRLAVLLLIGSATALAALHVGGLRYDHNLLNLQADGVPSVHAERELIARCGQSAWFAISLGSSPEQTQRLRNQFLKLPTVARVEEIGSVIAQSQRHMDQSRQVAQCAQRAALLRQASLAIHPAPDPVQPTSQYHSLLDPISPDPVVRAAHAGSPTLIRPISHRPMQSEELRLQQQIQQLAGSVLALSAPDSVDLADFPPPVRERMASRDGQTYLLRIFAKENLWQRENLAQFVREVESVDPRVTGHPIQTWYASGELEKSYMQAAIYALLAVAALLMIDLGSIRLVLLAMVPVAFSLLQLFGLLAWLDIQLNAANMIVLPLILGIGIDDGVHIVHDFRSSRNRRFRLGVATTTAIILTSITTMVGFGSMGISDHRGLQSLGIVLLIGVALCLVNSWLTLPAVLSLVPRCLALVAEESEEEPSPHCPGASAIALEATEPQTGSSAALTGLAGDASATGRQADSTRHLTPPAGGWLSDVPVLLSLPGYPEANPL
jgi:uncharacterized protein